MSVGAETVVLADDHPPVRAGVRVALERDGFVICAEAADGPGAVEAALRHHPDIVLMDINMPGNGIAATKEIARQLPDTAIVMLTVSTADADLFDALCAGARGYLLKGMDPSRLPRALRGVLEGEAALPRHLVALVIEEFRERRRHRRLSLAKERRVDLTEREWEVLELLREGLSTAEIGERLFIAPVTVRTHVSAILKKLQVPDRETAIKLLAR
jgi:DNA-binding NarL/FixJ family response regulator